MKYGGMKTERSRSVMDIRCITADPAASMNKVYVSLCTMTSNTLLWDFKWYPAK